MAGAEMITLLRNFNVEPKLNTFHYHRKKQLGPRFCVYREG
jgi:hypothetical protein